MKIREAERKDIEQIQLVRNSVKENALSDPGLITAKEYAEFMFERGKGWVCEIDDRIVGFSVADLQENNIWALFVLPGFEKRGIGRQLHNHMLDWYFSRTEQRVWLGTSPQTRAEGFYRKLGWEEAGTHGKNEIKFEMTFDAWARISAEKK